MNDTIAFLVALGQLHGFNVFILICAVYYLLRYVFYSLPIRLIRSFNIRKCGWPPAHLDADGDFKPEPKD